MLAMKDLRASNEDVVAFDVSKDEGSGFSFISFLLFTLLLIYFS